MNGLYIERRTMHEGPLSRDLAYHLFTRQLPGKIVVIADKPIIMLSVVSKQWQRVIRVAQRERASTLKAVRIQELTRSLTHMQRLHMRAYNQPGNGDGSVTFMEVADAMQNPPDCKTLYITHRVDDETFARLIEHMPAGALVVKY